MVKEFQKLMPMLEQIKLRSDIPLAMLKEMLDWNIHNSMNLLVEGYSRVKRCTNEGRALMSLDSQVFQTALQKLTELRPVPHANLVDNYIKAYYNPESLFLEWVVSHKDDYTSKQLLSLLNIAGANYTRRGRSELQRQVEEICARKERQAQIQSMSH